MNKVHTTNEFNDHKIDFELKLREKMMRKRYISLKRCGAHVKATLWNTPFFEGSHKERTKYEKSNEGEKVNSSLMRAQTRIYDLVEINLEHWNEKAVFLTLTYEQEHIDLRAANADFTNFIRKVKYKTLTTPQYLCVPEFQKRGTPHFHIIFFNLPFIFVSEETRTKLKSKTSQYAFNWNDLWTYGDVNVKLVKNEYTTRSGKKVKDGCARYMTKYLSKEFQDERLYGNKTYFTSRGLIKPHKLYAPLTSETYTWVEEVMVKLMGINENIETTFIRDEHDSEFFSIEGHDTKGSGIQHEKLSGKTLRPEK